MTLDDWYGLDMRCSERNKSYPLDPRPSSSAMGKLNSLLILCVIYPMIYGYRPVRRPRSSAVDPACETLCENIPTSPSATSSPS